MKTTTKLAALVLAGLLGFGASTARADEHHRGRTQVTLDGRGIRWQWIPATTRNETRLVCVPGHYETREECVTEPGHYETREECVTEPGRYETRERRVWVPARTTYETRQVSRPARITLDRRGLRVHTPQDDCVCVPVTTPGHWTTVCEQVFVPGTTRRVQRQVWVPGVTRTVQKQVWIPEHQEVRTVCVTEPGRWVQLQDACPTPAPRPIARAFAPVRR